ncbi:MAG TPA: penicillin-binding protein 2, partial [Candidatus Competibacteraceae bacterium]|nr:penicillin-binding protein 2 [Candidatus Competibacteraceae bacterium]
MLRKALIRMMTRTGLVLSLLTLATAGIVARAGYLQLVHKDFLQEQGDERFLRVVETPAHRGMIVDRNGEPLAVSSPVDSIWAQPAELLEQRQRWTELATALEMTTADLQGKLAGHETRQFIYLRRHLAPDRAERILQLNIPGVYSQREYRRYYPDAEVTSHLLGFTDIDDVGQEGLEKTFDAQLRGIPGQKRVIKDRLGRIVQDIENIQSPQPGQKLTLSIDRRLQYQAYRALKETV